MGPDAPDLAWVGAILTDDVRGFERAKLRLLNGVHSTLAYVGLLKGLETVFEAASDPQLAGLATDLMARDIIPTLTPPRGLDLAVYAEAILARFRNPEIRHLLSQIAWDGSQKLPFRILGTVSDALAAGRPVERLALPLAAWMLFVRRQTAAGLALVDPLAGRLAQIAATCTGEPVADVARFLALETVFSRDIAANPVLVAALEQAYGELS